MNPQLEKRDQDTVNAIMRQAGAAGHLPTQPDARALYRDAVEVGLPAYERHQSADGGSDWFERLPSGTDSKEGMDIYGIRTALYHLERGNSRRQDYLADALWTIARLRLDTVADDRRAQVLTRLFARLAELYPVSQTGDLPPAVLVNGVWELTLGTGRRWASQLLAGTEPTLRFGKFWSDIAPGYTNPDGPEAPCETVAAHVLAALSLELADPANNAALYAAVADLDRAIANRHHHLGELIAHGGLSRTPSPFDDETMPRDFFDTPIDPVEVAATERSLLAELAALGQRREGLLAAANHRLFVTARQRLMDLALAKSGIVKHVEKFAAEELSPTWVENWVIHTTFENLNLAEPDNAAAWQRLVAYAESIGCSFGPNSMLSHRLYFSPPAPAAPSRGHLPNAIRTMLGMGGGQ